MKIVRTLNVAFPDACVKADAAAKELLRSADVSAIADGRAVIDYK